MLVRVLPTIACAPFLLFLSPSSLSADQTAKPPVTVQAPGERLTGSLRQALVKRFAAAAIPVTISAWDGQLSTLQQREATGDAEPDVLLTGNDVVLAACRQGLLTPLAWGALGPRDAYPAASECGLPGFIAALVLAWDKTRDQTPPAWPDFWDVARYPGKRGLPKQARGTLEVALMADGVAAADIYRVLGAGDGVARAFRKLDQIRPYVVWWTDGDAALKALTSGSVMMTLAPASYQTPPHGQAPSAVGQQWVGAIEQTLTWAIPKRAPSPSTGTAFLRMQQQPAWQAAVTDIVPVVGAGQGVERALANDVLARTPLAPHRSEQMLHLDDVFWRDHPELSARFEAWLALTK